MLVAARRKSIITTLDTLAISLTKIHGPELEDKMTIIKRKVRKANHARLDKFEELLALMKTSIDETLPKIEILEAKIAEHRGALEPLELVSPQLEALAKRQKAVDAEQQEINRAMAIIELQLAPPEQFAASKR